VRKLIAEKYGLDKPLPQQYADYITAAVRGDLGPSYFGTRTVNQIISEGFPVTAALGLFALGSSMLVGIPLGMFAALRHNRAVDRFIIFFVTMGISIPNFVIGIFLIIVLAVEFRLLPTQFRLTDFKSWILPGMILALRPTVALVRLTRSATLEVLSEDYVRTARAKGLGSFMVNRRHILRNAMIPVVTLLGPMTADLITGSFIVESMFGVPGIGRTFVRSVFQRDYALFMGITLFYALIVVIFNLLVDLTYSFLDPRIARG
jgi:ABC-type dipeptide/oligopeptide/nickel transport system permease component